MSTPQVDVKALASLARLDVSDAELAQLEKEIPAILGFVETIQEVAADVSRVDPAHRNIMREDTNPHESGLYTKELLDAAPAQTKDGYLEVKRVISKE